ncbi:Gfo/Idh/MocA family oxidoreductase [Arachnia propionica]|uniref:Gfo/Idh/MocA family oxidoreductase n=1 Tax=Arachnia propionica TaxID=1750 RepID=UPI00163AE44B|nr:Gfo/Idh/MocA family oxidoreductase [Arachnia propionica]MDO5084289.1 Gfo/Idh/MocA family oxidoreductase [Arachnia propionica]
MSARVAVVGATFGAHYARALRHPAAPAELACIVGAGGRHSRDLADECGVPLRPLAEVTDVDAAVVAVRASVIGGAGDEIAATLLSRGIPVLQELPVHTRDLAESLRAARRGNAGFDVNPFYLHLDPMRRFIARGQELQRHSPAHRVVARSCGQTMHSTLFVLAELLQGPPPRQAEVFPGVEGHLARLDWAGTEVDLVIGARLDPADPDNLAQPLMSVTVSCGDGELHIDHPHGPTRWQPRIHMTGNLPPALTVPAAVVLPPEQEPSIQDALGRLWPSAIHRAISKLLTAPRALPTQRTLGVLRLWETISAELPPPVPVTAEPPTDRIDLLAAIR